MRRRYDYDVDEDDRISYNSGGNVTDKLTYLLVGGGIGALAALLLAPKAGRELRGDLADVTRKSYDKTRTTAERLRDQSGTYYQQLKQNAGSLYNRSATDKGSAKRSDSSLVDRDSTNLNQLKNDSFSAARTDDRLTSGETGERTT